MITGVQVLTPGLGAIGGGSCLCLLLSEGVGLKVGLKAA